LSAKKTYIELSRINEFPIFCRPYWLDSVCWEGFWDVASFELNGKTAYLPYYKKKRFGFVEILTQPKLTQAFTVLFIEREKICTPQSLQVEHDLLAGLLANFPKNKLQIFGIHSQSLNYLPYSWYSYLIIPSISYVIENISDYNNVLKGFNTNKKRIVKKSIDKFTIERGLDAHTFSLMKSEVIKGNLSYPSETLVKLINVCKTNNCGEVFYAVDNNGNTHSALFVVWDSKKAYHLVPVVVTKFKDSQSMTYLTLKVVEFLCNLTEKYDFEGGMEPKLEAAYRSYGATQSIFFFCKKKSLFSRFF
jgi:hypothetical protein